jgi:aspartyl-tRNA(Asn)/glutamyl-tRNA(Gln) amidotransferase subunit A
MNLTDLTIAEASAKLHAREISAIELTTAHNGAIAALNPRLNAYITTTPEQALEQAKAADAAIAAGTATPLTGIPLAIKDLFCTAGIRTTAASKILAPFIPPYESTVTAQLKAAGAVFLGKANLDEFAMGSSNITSG